MSEPQVGAREAPYGQIVLGDCRDILKRLPDECVDLVVATPQLRYAVSHRSGAKAAKRLTHEAALKILRPFLNEQAEVLAGCARVLRATGSLFWQVGVFREDGITIPLDVKIYGVLESLGLIPRGRIILTKDVAPPAGSSGANSQLNCSTYVWFSKSQEFTCRPSPEAGLRALIDCEVLMRAQPPAIGEQKTRHPAQDPEEIVARIVAGASDEGDIVLDPYMGSGTTAVVAAKLNRRFIGAEIDKVYVDMARERLVTLSLG